MRGAQRCKAKRIQGRESNSKLIEEKEELELGLIRILGLVLIRVLGLGFIRVLVLGLIRVV